MKTLCVLASSLVTLLMNMPAFAQPKAVLSAKAIPATLTVTPGAKTTLKVQLTIQSPYHVNANPASMRFLIPTVITLDKAQGMSVGKPLYPKGTLKKFTFFPTPLAVYQGNTVVSVPLSAAKTLSAGPHQLTGLVKYQACNDRVCLAPTTAKFAVTLQVAKGHH